MLKLLRHFVEALLFGIVAGFVLLVLAPVVLGWRPYTVLTGSMRPGIQPGDVVMDRPIPISQAHVGEVVTFSDPSRHNELVTHRIRSISHMQGLTNVETRGDANNTSEHWTIQTKDRVGLVVYRLPKIGKFAVLVRSRVGILFAIVVPVVLLAALTLRSIWKEKDDEDTDDDDPNAEADATSPAEPVDQPELDFGPELDPIAEPEPVAHRQLERAGAGADR